MCPSTSLTTAATTATSLPTPSNGPSLEPTTYGLIAAVIVFVIQLIVTVIIIVVVVYRRRSKTPQGIHTKEYLQLEKANTLKLPLLTGMDFDFSQKVKLHQ